MKNVMLSAIALFLFSFAAEAKTKEVKKYFNTCADQEKRDIEELKSLGHTDAEAKSWAASRRWMCENTPSLQ